MWGWQWGQNVRISETEDGIDIEERVEGGCLEQKERKK